MILNNVVFPGLNQIPVKVFFRIVHSLPDPLGMSFLSLPA